MVSLYFQFEVEGLGYQIGSSDGDRAAALMCDEKQVSDAFSKGVYSHTRGYREGFQSNVFLSFWPC